MKKLIEILPILSIVLIFSGYINLHFYYNEFNIQIYNYISNTELILSFLPNITAIITSLFFVFMSNLTSSEKYNYNWIFDESVDNLKSDTSKAGNYIFLLFLGFTFLYVIIKLILKKHFGFLNHEFGTLHFLLFLFLFLSILITLLKYSPNQIKTNRYYFLLFIIVFFTVYYRSSRIDDALKIKYGISDISMAFNYDNIKIQTDSNNILIGQTQSYIFIYDKIDLNSKIYKLDKCDSIVVK